MCSGEPLYLSLKNSLIGFGYIAFSYLYFCIIRLLKLLRCFILKVGNPFVKFVFPWVSGYFIKSDKTPSEHLKKTKIGFIVFVFTLKIKWISIYIFY